MLKLGCAIGGLLIGAMPAPAQEAPPPASAQEPEAAYAEAQDEEADDAEIIVTGELEGAVVGDIPPEQQLGPADIRAYGVSNVGELLAELAPQLRSGRGREGGGGPVVLLNGRRISGFNEIRELPTEAILRVDVFPEEVALKYGYRADQRVVNIVLRPRFRAITAELSGGMSAQGGAGTGKGDLNVLRINRQGRISLDMSYTHNAGLLESGRDVVSTANAGLFDVRGNISAPGGGEIDPALSALAGMPVTVAGVPGSAASGAPALADFAASPRNATDLSPYRTLVSPSEQMTVNAVYSRNLSRRVTASINARLDASSRESLLGLPGVALTVPAGNPFSPFGDDALLSRYLGDLAPLSRSNAARTAHLGFSVNGDADKWRWSVTGNYDRANARTITGTGVDSAPMQALLDADSPSFNPFAPIPAGLIAVRPADLARSVSSTASVVGLLNGPVARLPGGDISATVRVTGRLSDYESSSLRAGMPREGTVSRDTGGAQLSIDMPIASRRRAVLDAIGDLSLNANVEIERLSDFGRLVTTGYGAVWSPIQQLRLIASFTDEEGAPSAQQLGDPAVSTPNVRVFDYVRGETVDITMIGGGNPALDADSRHVMKLGLNARPFANTDLGFSADYVRSTTRNQIAGFPAATAQVEAAFPERFMRDSAGRLASIDGRPVNFARAEREELRWGFNFSMPLSSSFERQITRYREAVEEARRSGTPLPPPPEGLRRRQGQAGQGGQGPRRFGPGGGPGGPGGGGGFRGFGGPGGALAGRIQLAFYHTVRLKERIVIRDGLPVLDLLDGAAIGSRGGQPRHEVEVRAGVMKDGLGVRLAGRWQSGTQVDGGALGSGRTLDFSDLATVDLRFFADIGQQLRLVRKHRWMRGMRATLSLENMFDAKLRVTDQNGVTPLSYQPDLLDPRGRTIRLSVRKLFF